jgi:hypothetical protein
MSQDTVKTVQNERMLLILDAVLMINVMHKKHSIIINILFSLLETTANIKIRER